VELIKPIIITTLLVQRTGIFRPEGHPFGIALANRTTDTEIAEDLILPRSQTIVLANIYSPDNQTAGTLRFLKGTLLCSEDTIEGLTEKPEGATRIQVSIEADQKGQTVVREVGGTRRRQRKVPGGIQQSLHAIDR